MGSILMILSFSTFEVSESSFEHSLSRETFWFIIPIRPESEMEAERQDKCTSGGSSDSLGGAVRLKWRGDNKGRQSA